MKKNCKWKNKASVWRWFCSFKTVEDNRLVTWTGSDDWSVKLTTRWLEKKWIELVTLCLKKKERKFDHVEQKKKKKKRNLLPKFEKVCGIWSDLWGCTLQWKDANFGFCSVFRVHKTDFSKDVSNFNIWRKGWRGIFFLHDKFST